MESKKTSLDSFFSGSVSLVILSALCLAVVEVFLDWITWVQLNLSIVYSLPLVLIAAARNRRLVWMLTAFLIVMTFSVYFYQIARGGFGFHEPFFIDRILSAVTLLLMASLLHAWTLALDTLRGQRESIRAQNEQLESANQELLRCEEEIRRQNEELKQRRDDAEQASKRKTQLLASASHDIRNPANTIYLIADTIGRRAAEMPNLVGDVAGLIRDLQLDAESLVTVVSEVLDFTSFDSGQVSLVESEFSLNELLAEQYARLRTAAQSKHLFFRVNVPEVPIWLRTDRTKLLRILDNLVNNATKFTEAGGLTITAAITPDREVLIRVQDTGVGIDSDSLERIFDESVQLRSPERDRQKGWGLGLAICRRLITLMGGEISVESRLNHGSTFTVRLPSSCVLKDLEEQFPGAPANAKLM